jgi:hypothetical protein
LSPPLTPETPSSGEKPMPQGKTLSVEELSLSFEVLAGKRRGAQVPLKLQQLKPEEWAALSQLLVDLQLQKQGQTLH